MAQKADVPFRFDSTIFDTFFSWPSDLDLTPEAGALSEPPPKDVSSIPLPEKGLSVPPPNLDAMPMFVANSASPEGETPPTDTQTQASDSFFPATISSALLASKSAAGALTKSSSNGCLLTPDTYAETDGSACGERDHFSSQKRGWTEADLACDMDVDSMGGVPARPEKLSRYEDEIHQSLAPLTTTTTTTTTTSTTTTNTKSVTTTTKTASTTAATDDGHMRQDNDGWEALAGLADLDSDDFDMLADYGVDATAPPAETEPQHHDIVVPSTPPESHNIVVPSTPMECHDIVVPSTPPEWDNPGGLTPREESVLDESFTVPDSVEKAIPKMPSPKADVAVATVCVEEKKEITQVTTTATISTSASKAHTLFDLSLANFRRQQLARESARVSAIRVDSPIYPPSVYRTAKVPSHTLNPIDDRPWTERALMKAFRHYQRMAEIQPASPPAETDPDPDRDFDVWMVRDFYIFSPTKDYRNASGWNRRAGDLELAPLSHLQVKSGCPLLMLEGQVSFDGGRSWNYVDRLPFTILSVEGYGSDDIAVVGPENVYIQTELGSAQPRQVWLQLAGRPGKTYERYHWAFMWVATLGKYVVEFVDDILGCDGMDGTRPDVKLSYFHSQFAAWLQDRYGDRAEFRRWRACYGSSLGNDFRVAIVKHAEFLWKETCGVSLDDDVDVSDVSIQLAKKTKGSTGRRTVFDISLWRDILILPGPIPVQPQVYGFTVVSDYVRQCFSRSYFGELLGVVPCPDAVLMHRRAREKAAGFLAVPANAMVAPTEDQLARRQKSGVMDEIQKGDIVAVQPDQASGWKGSSSGLDPWFAYVQAVEGSRLFVLWLYRPGETVMGEVMYPIENELFLSDHCNCDGEPLSVDEVLYHARVSVLIPPFKRHGRSTGSAWAEAVMEDKARYFVRQAYLTVEHAFETITRGHLRCQCKVKGWKAGAEFERVPTSGLPEDDNGVRYRRGDCVLALVRRPEERLDPFVFEGIAENGRCVLRRLLRATEVLPGSHRPNVVVWTHETAEVLPSKIVRRCDIRFFGPGEPVLSPYCLGGSGDCWVLSYTQTDGTEVEPLAECPPGLVQGLDPTCPPPSGALPGLSLFTGGGGLDRGLEAAHAVRTRWAVEWDRHAIHTTRANAPIEKAALAGEHGIAGSAEDAAGVDPVPENVGFWLGSVDDFIGAALRGKSVPDPDNTQLIPQVGQVRFLSSGSPCQGFSLMQKFKLSESSRRNSSRVASTATALWLYLPDYFLIENVPNMARMLGPENIFAQLVSTAVGLGYQVRSFHVDGWTTGAPQSRCRLILSCAAPGLTPIEPPVRSHAHPPSKAISSLGVVAATGVRFGVRDFGPTPFPFVSAAAATADLPAINKGHLDICLAHPDHAIPFPQPPLQIGRIAQLPVYPRESCLWEVYEAKPGRMPAPIRADILSRRIVRNGAGVVVDKSWRRVHPDKLFPTVTTSCMPKDRFTGQILHWQDDRQLTIAEVRRAQGWRDEEVVLGSPPVQWKTLGNGVPRQIGAALGVRLRQAIERDWRRRKGEWVGERVGELPPWA